MLDSLLFYSRHIHHHYPLSFILYQLSTIIYESLAPNLLLINCKPLNLTTMTERREIYKCAICGNCVEIVNHGGGQLVCCGQPMKCLDGNTGDASGEKHVPVVTKVEGGYHVAVGSIAHPMQPDHYIQWIELLTPNEVLRKELKPADQPEATFITSAHAVKARIYCNLHGLWTNA